MHGRPGLPPHQLLVSDIDAGRHQQRSARPRVENHEQDNGQHRWTYQKQFPANPFELKFQLTHPKTPKRGHCNRPRVSAVLRPPFSIRHPPSAVRAQSWQRRKSEIVTWHVLAAATRLEIRTSHAQLMGALALGWKGERYSKTPISATHSTFRIWVLNDEMKRT